MMYQAVLIICLVIGRLAGGPNKVKKDVIGIKKILHQCNITGDTCGPIRYGSCRDVYRHTAPPRKSGVFTIYPDGKEVTVYCVFDDDGGYTYISKHSLNDFSHLDKLYTDKSHVMIRHVRSDGTQWEVKVEQLSRYKNNYSLGFLLNNNDGYNPMINKNMEPYLYIGFLPKSFAASKTTQGYRVKNVDQTFTNCDKNPNSYIGFLANPKGLPPNGYYKTCCNTRLVRKWIDKAYKISNTSRMELEFYSFFEIHMGGCGGYIVPNSIKNVDGAAVGFRFDSEH